MCSFDKTSYLDLIVLSSQIANELILNKFQLTYYEKQLFQERSSENRFKMLNFSMKYRFGVLKEKPAKVR